MFKRVGEVSATQPTKIKKGRKRDRKIRVRSLENIAPNEKNVTESDLTHNQWKVEIMAFRLFPSKLL